MRLTMMTTGFRPAALIERLRRSWDRHAGERALMMLSDDQLRDIGLTRSQVQAAAFGVLPPSAQPAAPAEPQHPDRRRIGRRLALAAAAALSIPVGLAAAAADPVFDGLPTVDDLPSGTVKVSPPVPGMGEHWANPQDLPLGPIYCVMGGKVICAEFMVAHEAFIEGKSFERLGLGMEGKLPPVNHLEMTHMPHGHEGFDVPHYDVRMYFVPPEARFPKQAQQ